MSEYAVLVIPKILTRYLPIYLWECVHVELSILLYIRTII